MRGRSWIYLFLSILTILLICKIPNIPGFQHLSVARSIDQPLEFYVAPFGNDQWSGLAARTNRLHTDGPFATLSHARDTIRHLKKQGKLQGPVTVYVRGGYFFLSEPLTFTPEDSGTAEAPITYTAYRDEEPILSGGQLITNWVKNDHGLYTTSLPEVAQGKQNFRQLFVNEKRRYRARTPNQGFLRVAELPGVDFKAPYNTPANHFRFAPGDLSPNWTNLTDVELVVPHFWVDAHLPIANIDEQTRIVTFSRPSRLRLTEAHRDEGARYYIDNLYEGLDQPGEWYLNRSTGVLSYLPESGEVLTESEVIVPRLTYLVLFEGRPQENQFVEYITFHGLTFSHNEWELPANDAGDLPMAGGVPGALTARGLHKSRIENCIFKNLGTYAIHIAEGSTDNLINGNEIAFIGAGGLRVGSGNIDETEVMRTGHNQITNNHLHDLGEIFHSGVGVRLGQAANNRIAHNLIHDLYYSGVSVGAVAGYKSNGSRDNVIEFNMIHTIGQKFLNDMGGIYLVGPTPRTVVRNNVIHHVDAWDYGGWGIYTDEGSSYVRAENNIVYNTKDGGFHQHYGRDNTIHNNIFAFSEEEQIRRTRAEPHRSFTFEKNIVYWESGPLLNGNWDGDGYRFNRNLYFKREQTPIQFAQWSFPQWSFPEWQNRGQDTESLIADPLFANPDEADFRLKAKSPAFQLGFQPIDTRTVGLEEPYRKRLDRRR